MRFDEDPNWRCSACRKRKGGTQEATYILQLLAKSATECPERDVESLRMMGGGPVLAGSSSVVAANTHRR